MRKAADGWKRKFQNMKLANKMILVYAVILSVCLLISTSALQISLRIYDEKLYEKSMQELDYFSQEVNDRLEDVEKLSYNIAIDTRVQEQLMKITTLNYLSAEYSYEMYRFRMMLDQELTSNKGIQNIIYTDGEKTKFMVGVATAKEIPQEIYGELLGQFHSAAGAYVTQTPTEEYPYMLSGRDIRKYIEDVSLDYLGSLIISTDVAGIIRESRDELEIESSSLCVYSKEGAIYESREGMYEDISGISGEKAYQILKLGGKRYFLCSLSSSKNGWTYVNIFPYSSIFMQSQIIRYVSIFGFLLLFAAAVLAMKKISHMLTRPLEKLTDTMQIVEEGDFRRARGCLEVETRSDEIGVLSQEFGVMLDRIETLIHENYEKQLLLKDTKYKMLQAQINPHFLYNTLNAIHWMIRVKRNEDAAKMIVVLGELLRAVFSKRQYVSVREEIELVKNYITIQEYRYQKRASFAVSVEPGCEGYQLPYMCIQPLVENSIYYGVENSLKPCRVTVSVRLKGDRVCIEVFDDGPGMSPEDLEAARNFTIRAKGNGIGLKNIYERLKLAYQNPEFEIDSKEGAGTTVRICVPKKETI